MIKTPSWTFRNVVAWQKAHAFVLSVYRMTARFPKGEMYGLTSQFRRAAVSIPANSAEGFGKSGLADKARFMNMRQGSLEECRYYRILSQDLGDADTDSLMHEMEDVRHVLDCLQ
ncbi:MAG TPA: four helix bundle protein [Candidatus Hydrogenedentes bacterium]|nr:four helix bundle protein [Candidatus Hydrogenedentota bacterium]